MARKTKASKKAKKTKKKTAARKAVKKSAARKAPARKAKAPARKTKSKKTAKAPVKKSSVKKSAATKSPAKTAVKKPAPRRKQIVGEGDYAASRAFLKDQTGFVTRNEAKIPGLAKQAERDLDGPGGNDLRAAEAEARSHSKAGNEE